MTITAEYPTTMLVYQAITTRYLGPTTYRGSRIKAKAAAGSLTISYDDSLNSEQAHAKAAKALAQKFGWSGTWYQGGMPDDRGYCFVNVAARDRIGEVPACSFVIEGVR